MSVTITSVLASGATGAATNATASYTPDTTAQYFLAINSYVSAGSAIPTITSVSGNGLTWTLVLGPVNADNAGTDRTSLWVYAASGSGGSTGTITITWGTIPTKASWCLDKISGADSGLHSGTLLQSPVSGVSSAANPSATLASAVKSGSVSYAVAGFESSTGTLTPGSGYTQLAQVVSQSLAWIISEWNSSGSTTATATNSVTTNRHAIILIEVGVAVSGTVSIAMHKLGLSGSGIEKVSVTGSVRLHKLGLSGSGIEKVSVTGSVRLHKLGLSGSGIEKVSVTGSVRLHKLGLSAIGIVMLSSDMGTGFVFFRKMSLSGSGTERLSASGSVAIKNLILSGMAIEKDIGSGSIALRKMNIRGTNTPSNLFIFTAV
jgi:hypothetical protein